MDVLRTGVELVRAGAGAGVVFLKLAMIENSFSAKRDPIRRTALAAARPQHVTDRSLQFKLWGLGKFGKAERISAATVAAHATCVFFTPAISRSTVSCVACCRGTWPTIRPPRITM